MNLHMERAREIAREIEEKKIPAAPVVRCGRQGDVILRRVGDSARGGRSTPSGGRMIVSGSHGEHRIIANSLVVEDSGVLDLARGGVLVHTDVPAARHGALELAPGRWEVIRERELGLDQVIRKVVD